MNSTSTRKITLDNTDPEVDFISPTPVNNSNQSSASFDVNVTHNETNPDTIQLYFDDELNQSDSYSGTETEFTIDAIVEGVHTYYAWLNDSAGNSYTTEIRTITTDYTVPRVDLESPGKNTWIMER